MWVVIAIFAIIVLIAFVKNFWPLLLIAGLIAIICFAIYWAHKVNQEDKLIKEEKQRQESIKNSDEFKSQINYVRGILGLLSATTANLYKTTYLVSDNQNHPNIDNQNTENSSDNDCYVYLHLAIHGISNYIFDDVLNFRNTYTNDERLQKAETFTNLIFANEYSKISEIINVYEWITAILNGKTAIDNQILNTSVTYFTIKILCPNNLKGADRNIFINEIK